MCCFATLKIIKALLFLHFFINMKVNFLKKAIDRVYFTCEDGNKAFEAVEKSIQTGEATEATFRTIGKMKDGTVVSEFEFTWSFKQRKKS